MKSKPKILKSLLPVLGLLVAGLPSASAADGTWSGAGTDTYWSTAGNWNTIPGSTTGTTNQDNATFNRTPAADKRVVTLDSDINLRVLSFQATGTTNGAYTFNSEVDQDYAIRLSSGDSDSINTAALSTTTTQVFNTRIVLEGESAVLDGTQRFRSINGNYFEFNGGISGGTTTGKISLTLTGNSTGRMTFNGIISDGNAGGKVNLSNTLPSGMVTINGANTYSGGTYLGTSSVSVLGHNQALGTGTVTVDGAVIQSTANKNLANLFVLEGNLTLTNNSNLSFQGGVSLGTAEGDYRSISINAGVNLIDSVIYDEEGQSKGITKVGAGVLTLSAANTFKGGFNLNNGTVTLTNDQGFGTGTVTVAGASAPTIVAANRTVANDFILNSGVAITNSNGLEIQGDVSLGTAVGDVRNLSLNSGTVTISGVISDADAENSKGIGKSSGGVLVLTGTNTYTGTTTISGGTLRLEGSAATLGAGAVTNNGTLQLERTGEYVVANDISGTGAVTKASSGKIVLEGDNSYTGATTINAGTLLVNGTHTNGGAYTINSSTLGGTGSIEASNMTFNLAAMLSPGDGETAGTLEIDLGATTLNISNLVSGSTVGRLEFDLAGVNSSDKILLSSLLPTSHLNIGTGLMNFNDFTFNLLGGFTGGEYILFQTGTEITGTLGSSLTGLIDGSIEASIGFSLDKHNIVLSVAVIPEPGTSMLALLGMGLLAATFRYKTRRG